MWQSGTCDICANIKILEDYIMEKYIYNEQNGLWYELQGDYYIPCLVLDEEDTQPIGMWGRKHLRYIKAQRPILHTTLLLSGKDRSARYKCTFPLCNPPRFLYSHICH